MEGNVLSGEDQGRRHAGLVCRAPADGRDQQHVLSNAEDGSVRKLGCGNARELPVCDQGVTPDHPPRASQGRVGDGIAGLSLPEPRVAGRQARSGAVSVAAESEKGPAAPDGVSAPAAGRSPRRVRISRRQAGSPTTSTMRSKAPARRYACPSARTTRRRRWSRPRRGATCGCDSKRTPTTICGVGCERSKPLPGAGFTSTSCTSQQRRRMRKR